MKKLALLAILGTSVCSLHAENAVADNFKDNLTATIRKMLPAKRVATRSDVDYSRRPKQIECFIFEDNEWILYQTDSYIWFAPEKPSEVISKIEETGENSKEVFTYNDDNAPLERKEYISEGTAGDWQLKAVETWKYDEKSPGFVIENITEQPADNGDMSVTSGYKNTIIRNDAGNVVSQINSEYSAGEFEPVFKSEIIYGSDGKATSINFYEFTDGDDTEKVMSIKDITWKATDGQFLFGDSSEGVFSVISGANRISKATVTMYQEGEVMIEVPLTASYTDYSMTAKGTATFQGVPANIRFDYQMLDFGGSRTDVEVSVNMVVFSYKMIMSNIREYNEWGMCTLNESSQKEGTETTIEFQEVYDLTLGDDGYPSFGILSVYNEERGALVPTQKDVYSEYGETSVPELTSFADEDDRYFNLQGIEIAKPAAPGLYILRRNGSTKKIIVK